MYYKFIIYQNKKFCSNTLYAVPSISKFRVRNGNTWLAFQTIYTFNCQDYNSAIFLTINHGYMYFIIIVSNPPADSTCLLPGEDQCHFGSINLSNVHCTKYILFHYLS